MSTLDTIATHGNRGSLSSVSGYVKSPNDINCVDGFHLSVLAGDGCYCSPRPSDFPSLGEVPSTYAGPFRAVEVGIWGLTEHPTPEWETYADGDPDGNPDGITVYAYVPVALVAALIEAHGGEK